jgi:hypothetical protein
MMRVFRGKERLALIATVFLSVLIMWSCATSIKYSYDTKASFSELKSYTWGQLSSGYGKDLLLEKNVQVLADQLLTQKGFTRTSEKSDLMITIDYELSYGSSQYELRMLNLNIYKIENKELVWRGTAFGTIKTDAVSGDLKQAVQGILLNFPPK